MELDTFDYPEMPPEIDLNRLKLIVTGDIHPDHRGEFDIDKMVRDAYINDKNQIVVTCSKFGVLYNAWTYQQITGVDDNQQGADD